jgi:anti-sigma factor RsiW
MDLHDLTAAYALDALDADETLAYEAHLAQCERCREELAAVGVGDGSPGPSTSPAPRQALRDASSTPRPPSRTCVPLPAARGPWPSAHVGGRAVAACVAVGLGVWASTLSHSVNQERARARRHARAVEILADPASPGPARQRPGVVAVDPTARACSSSTACRGPRPARRTRPG